MAEHVFCSQRFRDISGRLLDMYSNETNLVAVFLRHVFRQLVQFRLLSLAGRAIISADSNDMDFPEAKRQELQSWFGFF